MIYKTIKNDIEAFCEKVNAEKWTDFVGAYSEIGDSRLYGGKHGGSDAEREGAEYIAQRLKEIGVGRVEFVKTPASRYQFNDAELKVIGVKEPMEIRPYGYRSPGTDKDGITAPLIDAGTATRDELKNIDIKGKIAVVQGMDVLEAGNLIAQMEECIINGAAAVLIYAAEDILNEDTIRVQTPMNVSPIPIVGISMRHAKYLKGLLEQGEITVNLTVDCDYTPAAGTTYNVVGEIPGSCSDEKIVYTAHLDHFFRCLQDNMASCAALLGIAEAIVKPGYKPKRSIIFAFNGSHECGIKTAKMRAILKKLEAVSVSLLEALRKSNERYLTGDTSKPQRIYEETSKINEKVLALFDYFQQKIDGIAPSDFLVSRSGKYLMHIGLFGEAEEALMAGDTVKALEQLLQVDMAGISYYFSRQTAERMCRQINGKEFAHTRTWASGKELKCSSHYELMSGLKPKIDGGATDFDEEIKLIGKAAKKEMIPFIIELKKEFGVIRKAIKNIEKLEAEI